MSIRVCIFIYMFTCTYITYIYLYRLMCMSNIVLGGIQEFIMVRMETMGEALAEFMKGYRYVI